MKKMTAIIFTALSITAASTTAIATEEAYTPWTFDDFNSNCELVETTASQKQSVAMKLEIPGDEDVGELGW